MTRSFRSSTALAIVLAASAPLASQAETPLASGVAEPMDATARADMPQRATALDRELARGLTADQLTCAVPGNPRPCPDGMALVTPRGQVVYVAQDGGIVLAPRAAQVALRDGDTAVLTTPPIDPAAAPAVVTAAADSAPAPAPKGKRAERKAAAQLAQAQTADAPEPAAGDAPTPTPTPAPAPKRPKAKAGQAPSAPAPDANGAAADDAARAAAEAAIAAQTPAAEAPSPAAPPAPRKPKATAAPVAQPDAPVAAAPVPDANGAAADDAARAAAEAAIAAQTPAAGTPAPAVPPVPKKPRTPAASVEPSDAPVAGSAPVPKPEAPAPVIIAPTPAPEVAAPRPSQPPAAVTAPVPAPVRPAQPPAKPAPQAADAPQPDADALAKALAQAAGVDAPAAPRPGAATGKADAPQAVVVDSAQKNALDAALQAAADAPTPPASNAPTPTPPASNAPTPSAPQPSQSAAANQNAADAAAIAAATGAAPRAEALSAPPVVSTGASTVVVTDKSARSSREDFGTRISDSVARAQQAEFQRLAEEAARAAGGGGAQVNAPQAPGMPPVVNGGANAPTPAAGGSGAESSSGGDDLGKMVLAGIGGYLLSQLVQQNAQIALNTGDRVVVQMPDGSQQLIKDDDALLLQPGAQVTTENFPDGSSRTIVTRTDGSRVVTIRDGNLQVLRRTLIAADGGVTELINDAAPVAPVVVSQLPPAARPVELTGQVSEQDLRDALQREAAVNRRFTLGQIRNIEQVRALAAPIDISAITFDTGSAAIRPDQAQQLATLGKIIAASVQANPREVYMIEGYTDTVGSEVTNLALSDRRAESVALALTEYFRVPPENLVVQGYGERFLKVPVEGDVRENRRASIRRITNLLATN